jgi:hypothetical protein
MFELTDTRPDWNVQEEEYIRLLGYPRRRKLQDRARELADWARDWFGEHGRPWIYARQTEAIRLGDSHFDLNGTEFSSRLLHEQFEAAQAQHAVVVAVSAGPESETHAQKLWQDNKPDEYFFLEMFGSAVVEHLVAVAYGRICAWADAHSMIALPHHSPGYSGWDISEQNKLWELLRVSANQSLPGELNVLESGMLRPKKSLLALVGVASDSGGAAIPARLVPCESCLLARCQFRRAPYLRAWRPVLS